MNKDKHWQQSTLTIHGGHQWDAHGALVSPLYQTATFAFETAEQGGARFAGKESGYIYTRFANPTTNELEQRMALLEGAQAAVATASGMAAITGALLAHLAKGEHLIASHVLYGGTLPLLNQLFPRFGIEVSLVDFADLDAVEAAIQPNTKVIFCETPVNPHLTVYDLAKVAAIAQQHKLFSVVDNTFMTPLLQQPLSMGIDMVLHSATKYLNGHGDVIAGIVCGDTEAIAKVKREIVRDMGAVISPHDAWLILRGLKTLDVRMQRHCDNADAIANMLEVHPKVNKVHFPGLASHSGYGLMGKQMRRAGGVIAFELDSDYQSSIDFVNQLQLFTIAVSLGDPESLIQHPASMTHLAYSQQERQRAGITDSQLRIAVGLESADDLLEDLLQALAKI